MSQHCGLQQLWLIQLESAHFPGSLPCLAMVQMGIVTWSFPSKNTAVFSCCSPSWLVGSCLSWITRHLSLLSECLWVIDRASSLLSSSWDALHSKSMTRLIQSHQARLLHLTSPEILQCTTPVVNYWLHEQNTLSAHLHLTTTKHTVSKK